MSIKNQYDAVKKVSELPLEKLADKQSLSDILKDLQEKAGHTQDLSMDLLTMGKAEQEILMQQLPGSMSDLMASLSSAMIFFSKRDPDVRFNLAEKFKLILEND